MESEKKHLGHYPEPNPWLLTKSSVIFLIFLVLLVLGIKSSWGADAQPLQVQQTVQTSQIHIGPVFAHFKKISDGVWQQSGEDNKMDNDQQGFAISYLGGTPIRWLDYEVGLLYLKGPKASGAFLTDDCYNERQYSGGHNKSCDRRYYASDVSSVTHGMTLTLNPTWRINKESALSFALGGLIFKTTEGLAWDSTRGYCAEKGVHCEFAEYKEDGITPYAGITFTYSHAYITAFYAKDIGGPQAMSSSVYGWHAGYNHAF